jgi:recombination associated protein RdgC
MSMFKNAVVFRYPRSLDMSQLAALAVECVLKPVGPLELSSRGFIPVDGSGADYLTTEPIPGVIFFAIGGEDKILPGAVVNAELKKKIDAIEEREGRKVGGKTKKRLKDDLLHELLPKALVKPSRVEAYIDTIHGEIVVDTSSRKVAENVVSEVRRALGSFPALPINAEVAPRSVLTGWIAGEPLPDGLALGEEAILKDALQGGAVARLTSQELAAEEVMQHLEAGKQVTRLALIQDGHVSYTFDEDLVIRKLKFLDGAIDQLENTEHDDLAAELSARRALVHGELSRVLRELFIAFKVSAVE